MPIGNTDVPFDILTSKLCTITFIFFICTNLYAAAILVYSVRPPNIPYKSNEY